MRILAATGNANKLAELRTVAREFAHEIVSPKELQRERNLPPPPDVEENGTTFATNALLKAVAFMQWGAMPTLGDDSGLEVAALDNQPGVFSARYAGEGASDNDRIQKVLRELDAKCSTNPALNRYASFRCALVLLLPDGGKYEAEGMLAGKILEQPRGDKGFGYDPIVYLDDLGSTLAEVEFEVTCQKGFRAIAARKLFASLGAAKL